MSSGETARQHYISARNELVERIRLRDSVLLVYLAIIGTLFGIALGNSSRVEILLTIPIIACGCSILVSQHNLVIGALLGFITNDLKPFMKSISEAAPEFGSSKTFYEHSCRSNRLRTVSHAIIMIVPCVVALYYNRQHAFNSSFPLGQVWWISFGCMVVAIAFIIIAHNRRMLVWRQTKWDK